MPVAKPVLRLLLPAHSLNAHKTSLYLHHMVSSLGTQVVVGGTGDAYDEVALWEHVIA